MNYTEGYELMRRDLSLILERYPWDPDSRSNLVGVLKLNKIYNLTPRTGVAYYYSTVVLRSSIEMSFLHVND